MVNESFRPLNDKDQKATKDITAILTNIRQMFVCYRHCVNETAACAVLIGLGIEAQTLALKLQAMYMRWKIYIPFHEALDIDFKKWAEDIDTCIQAMMDIPTEQEIPDYQEYLPGEEYLFDLYAMSKECKSGDGTTAVRFFATKPESDIAQETKQYVKDVKVMIREMQAKESNYWLNEVCDLASAELRDAVIAEYEKASSLPEDILQQTRLRITLSFNSICNYDEACRCAIRALTELKKALLRLEGYFKEKFTNEMFIRFSRRIYFHLCQKHYTMASDQVDIWQNTWPEEDIKNCAAEEKKNIMEILQSQPYGRELSRYIHLEAPDVINAASFGRFLNKNREKLTRDDVREIHYYCRIIQLLNQIIGAAPTHKLTPDERKVLDMLENVALHADCPWRNVTGQQVLKSIRQALGLDAPLPEKYQDLSQKLWQLFTHRERCNRNGKDISFMATWLNIVGYCMSLGYVQEGNAPTLCRNLFHDCHDKDYNFITKVNNGEYANNFRDVISLLEYCLKEKM